MSTFRTDIQALRAIAVLLVVAFHVWPTRITGGYVGVDVFFVISGYLITGHLLREVAATGRIDLPTFYARRARRLLPAASLTLVVVGLAAYLWMPVSTWAVTASDMAASTLYAENWMLVRRSVDYHAQGQTPSPLQHFWSLSVEEQFYLVWPLLVGGVATWWRQGLHPHCGDGDSGSQACVAKTPTRPPRRAFALPMTTLCCLSFAAAQHVARSNPAPGYFMTFTRLHELGLGGLLSVFVADRLSTVAVLPQAGTLDKSSSWACRVRTLGAATGLAAIGGTAFFYSPGLPFPGIAALVPSLGAMVFILAGEHVGDGSDYPHALGPALAQPWLQYVGDLSFSLYLAHWPVVVMYRFVTGRPVDGLLVDSAAALALSWALAHACNVCWENRFRDSGNVTADSAIRTAVPGLSPPFQNCVVTCQPKQWTRASNGSPNQPEVDYKALRLLLGCIGCTLSASLWLSLMAKPSLPSPVASFVDNGSSNKAPQSLLRPGAEAFVRDAPPTLVHQDHSVCSLSDVVPPLSSAPKDIGSPSIFPWSSCLAPSGTTVKPCTAASRLPPNTTTPTSGLLLRKPHIVLLGDSHAAHWLPALHAAAEESSWTATALAKSSCMPTNVTTVIAGGPYNECRVWLENALAWIVTERPAAVILSAYPGRRVAGLEEKASQASLAAGVVQIAGAIASAGIPVLAMKHTPIHRESLPLCLEAATGRKLNMSDAVKACTSKAGEVIPVDGALVLAARQFPNMHLLNFDDAFCDAQGACPPIIGNILVYRDSHHLTATYVQTIGPVMRRRLVAALQGKL